MSRAAIAGLLALALAACGDNNPAPGTETPDGPGPGTADDLTAFVIDLIENQTADTTPPVAFEVFSALPDPAADNNATDAYAQLFR